MLAAISTSMKRKVTLYISDDVLRATRVAAARGDKRDSEVVEEALRKHLGFSVLDRVWGRSRLSDDEAMKLAVAETRAYRRKRAARRS